MWTAEHPRVHTAIELDKYFWNQRTVRPTPLIVGDDAYAQFVFHPARVASGFRLHRIRRQGYAAGWDPVLSQEEATASGEGNALDTGKV